MCDSARTERSVRSGEECGGDGQARSSNDDGVHRRLGWPGRGRDSERRRAPRGGVVTARPIRERKRWSDDARSTDGPNYPCSRYCQTHIGGDCLRTPRSGTSRVRRGRQPTRRTHRAAPRGSRDGARFDCGSRALVGQRFGALLCHRPFRVRSGDNTNPCGPFIRSCGCSARAQYPLV